jgi:murein DD-endopeptidase MepM/ murein hydrolase activator NlpD
MDKTRKLVEIIEKRNNLKQINEVSSASNTFFGGKRVKIPSDGGHAITRDWQSRDAWDIPTERPSAVYALGDGKVRTMRDSGASPRTIEGGKKRVYGVGFTVDGINGAPNIFYAHLENVQVKIGDTIKCGQLLGFVADSGYIKYDHVHIGIDDKINIRNLIDSNGGIKCASGKKLTSKEVESPKETSSNKEQKPGEEEKTGESSVLSNLSSVASDVASKLTGKNKYYNSDTFLVDLTRNFLNMKESREYGNFGKNASIGTNKIVLPSADNTTIDAPIAGKIVKTNQLGCRNELSILHEVNGEEYYLTYCDITNPSVSVGDNVRRGTRLGSITNDISIYVFNLLGQKLDFLSVGKEEKKNKGGKNKEVKKKKYTEPEDYSTYSPSSKRKYFNSDDFVVDALKLPFKVLSSLTKGGLKSVTSKKVDDEETSKPFELPGGLKSVTSKKVDEEIERIKRLLK